MSKRMLLLVALVAATSWPAAARAQKVEHGRGDINAIDRNRGEVELRDPQGRVRTWRFERDATVKVSDDSRPFTKNPTTADLRPPMYVHFTYVNDVIQTFDIIEIRVPAASTGQAGGSGQAASPRTVVGRVTSYDPNVRQVEVDHDGKRETFQLTARSDQRLNPGDRVQLNTEWVGTQELVSQTKVLGGGNATPGNSGRGGSSGAQSAQGRVVRVSRSGVVMQVAGAQQTYAVDNAQLLQKLRVGNTVQFSWQDRNGQMYITDVR